MANPRKSPNGLINAIGGNVESLRREGSDMASLIELANELNQMAGNLRYRIDTVYCELFGPSVRGVTGTSADGSMPSGQIHQIAQYLRDTRDVLQSIDEAVHLFEDRTGMVPDRSPFVQDTVKAARG